MPEVDKNAQDDEFGNKSHERKENRVTKHRTPYRSKEVLARGFEHTDDPKDGTDAEDGRSNKQPLDILRSNINILQD